MKSSPARLLLFCAAAVLFGCAGLTLTAQADETQRVLSCKRAVTKTVGYDYLLSLPTGYDAATGRRWPLILFLHSAGERGADPWLVAKHGPPKLLRGEAAAPKKETPEARARREEATKQLSANFIVVSPQCPSGQRWDDDTLLALLDDVLASQKVDARRVYLTGPSMGGFGTWSLATRRPERFAAIAPICGGGQAIDILLASFEQKTAALQGLGVWAFHGAKDDTVPPAESEHMVNLMKQAGAMDVQLTIYPEAKHDVWTQTYANPDLYAWLLNHQR